MLSYWLTPVRESTPGVTARINALYLVASCSDSRRMVHYLAADYIPISEDHVRNFMPRMGLQAIYQKQRTTCRGIHPSAFPA